MKGCIFVSFTYLDTDTITKSWLKMYLRTRYRYKLGWFFLFGPIQVTIRRNLARNQYEIVDKVRTTLTFSKYVKNDVDSPLAFSLGNMFIDFCANLAAFTSFASSRYFSASRRHLSASSRLDSIVTSCRSVPFKVAGLLQFRETRVALCFFYS